MTARRAAGRVGTRREAPGLAWPAQGTVSGIIRANESEAEDNVTADPAPLAQRPPEPPDPLAPVIATTALTRRYPGPVTALDQLTVAVGPGITGLVGSNGAGK